MAAAATTTIDFNPLQRPRTGIHDLPPEILASAFETLIYTSHSDITLILPLTLVCHAWHSLITHTPRLWGILTVDKYTDPHALAKRIARAKASPLSITVSVNTGRLSGMRFVRDKLKKKATTLAMAMAMAAQLKALASLVRNWVELDVGVEFLVSVCELYRNRDRQRESEVGSLEPIGCDAPVLGWVDMCTSLRSLTLTRGQHGHEAPAAFFTHREELLPQLDVGLHHFTSVSLPKRWILGFLGPHIRTLRLLRGERVMPFHYNRWGNPNNTIIDSGSAGSDWKRLAEVQCIGIDDMFAILRRVPNVTHIELERTVWSWPRTASSSISQSPNGKTIIYLPSLRDLTLRGVLYTSLILATIRAPALRTLCVDHTDGGWDEPLAPVFVQWSQPGYVMSNLHTLELVNCLRWGDDDVAYLVRWLGGMNGLVRLFIVEETQSLRGLEDVEEEDAEGEGEGETPRNLFKALGSPQRMIPGDLDSSPAQWLCPSLMILRVDLIDTPIQSLISIARARGGVVPSSPSAASSSESTPMIPPPARLRTIETRLCASAHQADIDLLASLVDTAHCICDNCALHLPLDNLTLGMSMSDPDV